MILSYSWLKEMVDLPVSPTELIEVLTFLGLEVEESVTYAPSLENVVIGEIVECAHVEGTDHLSHTKTNVGGETLSIVCGAPNARAGLKVVVMLPGSKTASGQAIKKARLRGIESIGMIASEVELGLSSDHSGIIEGDGNWKPGAKANDYLGLADTTYDVEVTPNRPDFLSHVGVARDLAAKFRIPWRWPEYALTEIGETAVSYVSVEIKAPEACPRYSARVVRGVKIATSPYRTRLRLTRCGLRPISNIVDATNLAMLEFGQPLHAFDARFVDQRKIIVRYAAEKEKFTTLDGKEHALSSRDLLIADPSKGIALAGIMGGLNSEIRDDTQDVIIECAYFEPVHVRRTSKALGISTDSGRRFERGMDPNGIERVINATASLMQTTSGGEVLSGIVDQYPKTIEPRKISFRSRRCAAVVGLDIKTAEMVDTLVRLGCTVSKPGAESIELAAPTFRPDLEREIDLIEEVIRVHGYEEIPTAITSRVPLESNRDPLIELRRNVVDVMVSLGFLETLSVSMYTPDERRDPPDMPSGVQLANPVTDDMKVLQGSVLPHLVKAASANWQRGDRDLRLFEVAKVFHEGSADDPRTWERLLVTGIVTGRSYPQGWAHPAKSSDFYDLKGVLDVLCHKISLDKLEIYCYDIDSGELLKGDCRSGGQVFGKWGVWSAGEMARCGIDAQVGWFEIELSQALKLATSKIKYAPLPRFPVAWRDLAMLLDAAVPVGSILTTITKAGGECLVKAEPFDVFQSDKLGEGKKSVAIHLEFSHPDRSLEAEEVDRWVNEIITSLQKEHGATLR